MVPAVPVQPCPPWLQPPWAILLAGVELHEGHPNEDQQRRFIQGLLYQGSQSSSSVFGKDPTADRGAKKLYSEKEKGCRDPLIGGRLHGEAGGE